MSPSRVRLVFAALSVICVLGMLQAATEWQHARRAVAAIATALVFVGATPVGATPGRATQLVSFDSALPEAVLAHAVALSRGGRHQQALQTFKALLSERASIRLTALYDLGNLNLRESLRNGAEGAQRALPLVELSKQSYRDVLREDPQDWDARYNLERALWLSPEYDDPVLQRNQAPTHSEHAASTVQGARIDLP
jgi:mxaK protein